MNRKSKVIVSIVGIIIVTLSLLGITYAYYLTRIEGNTNTNSISVTTADLKLVYGDGNGSIIGSGKTLVPDNDNPIGTKTFTVTNNGNEKVEDYAVIIENFAVKYHSGINAGEVTNLVNGEDGNPDIKLVITCKSYKNYDSTKVETGTCNGMDGYLPEKSDILLINDIDKEITHEYTATLTYLDDGTNQSDDMNKTITGKFNIIDTKNTIDVTGTVETYTKGDIVTISSEDKESVIYIDGTYKLMGVKPDIHSIKVVGNNTIEIGKLSIKNGTEVSTTGITISDGTTIPEVTMMDTSRIVTINLNDGLEITNIKNYIPYKEETLAYNIINNIQNGDLEKKTTFVENLSSLGMVNNVSAASDKLLSTAEDDYTHSTGKFSYYFRGNPIDNYVSFAGMCWRIVRIQGDGSIKLILSSELSCSETNLTDDSGYATDGVKGVKGTVLTSVYGYKNQNGYYINDYINSPENNSKSARVQLNSWLVRKISEEEQNFLKDESWCIGDLTNAYSYDNSGIIVGMVDKLISNATSFYYISSNKYWVTKTPSYKCETTGKDGEVDINKVGMITFDEMIYAGGGNKYNINYYLNNNAMTNTWWSLSPNSFFKAEWDSVFRIGYDGFVGGGSSNSYYAFRALVTLKSGTIFTGGEGTIDNPYVIG